MSEEEIDALAKKMLSIIQQKPIYFFDILITLRNVKYKDILRAFGKLRSEKLIARDDIGRYMPAKEQH